MVDWASELLGEEAPPHAQAEAAPDFAGELLRAPEAERTHLAPIEGGRDAGIGGSFVTGFASDDAEAIQYLASELYPDEDMGEAVKRFGKRDGQLYHRGDDGKVYKALPSGWSMRDFVAGLAANVGPSIPAVAGAVTGIMTAPGSPALAIPAAMGVGAAGEMGRQKIGDMLMGDASTAEGPLDANYGSVAFEGAINAAGQGVGELASKGLGRHAVREIDRLDLNAAKQSYAEADDAGVRITPAEATGSPSLGIQQKLLANRVETADEMNEFLGERSEEVIRSWNSSLDDISRAADAEDVGKGTRSAARKALSSFRAALRAKAKPVYDKAYANPVEFTESLEDLLQRPVMNDALAKARNLAANEGIPFNQFFADIADDGAVTVTRVPDARGWDYVKRGLDEILGSDKAINKRTGGMNNLGRIVSGIKTDLMAHLDDLNPDYAKARAIYSEGAGEVTTAMESALGVLAKTKDTNVLKAAKHIFDPRTRSPEMVKTLRVSLAKADPQAWQAIKRLYMQDVTTDALRITEMGDVVNPAGKLYKAFSNPRVQANLRAAMTRPEWSRMQDLLAVYKKAASVPGMRSDTAMNLEFMAKEEAAGRPLLAKGVEALRFTKWPQKLSDWLTERNMAKHSEAVVKLVTSGDPVALEKMRELKKLSPKNKNFIRLFGHLVTRGAVGGIGEAIPESNYEPEE